MINFRTTVITIFFFGVCSVQPVFGDHLTTKPGEERKIFHSKWDNQGEPRKDQTGWGLGLRTGGSFYLDDSVSGTSDDPAILLNGQVFYWINDDLHFGVMVEWERHNNEVSGLDFGYAQTISIFPYAEFRLPNKYFTPYIAFGAGMNFNSFTEEENIAASCTALGFGVCDIKPENTVGAKVAIGGDYFFTPNLSFNAEGSWKLNSGDADFNVGGTTVATTNLNASVAQVMVGLRWYFR